MSEKTKENNVVILTEENIESLQDKLNAHFEKGYAVSGGVTPLPIGAKVWYCVVVIKPF